MIAHVHRGIRRDVAAYQSERSLIVNTSAERLAAAAEGERSLRNVQQNFAINHRKHAEVAQGAGSVAADGLTSC
jgi:hypothetical protein